MDFKSLGGAAIGSAVIFLASANAGMALDGNDFASKLNAALATGGISASFGSVTVDADVVTLSDITLKMPGAEEHKAVPGSVVFSGVSETGDGGYTAETASISDVLIEEDGARISAQNIEATGIRLPAEPGTDPLEAMQLYRTVSAGPLAVAIEGKEAFTIASINVAGTPDADLTRFVSKYAVEGIHADLSLIEDDEVQAGLEAFGIMALDASMRGEVDWNLQTGNMDILESSITVEQIGRLNLTAALGGYDLELVTAMQKLQNKLAAADVDGEEAMAAQQQSLALMLAKMTLAGASIRYDDDGLATKLLEFAAAQQGTTPEVLVQGFAAMIPALLVGSGLSEEDQGMIGTAAKAFLEDPRSLEASITSEEPVPMSAVAEAAESENPMALRTLFDLRVTANE